MSAAGKPLDLAQFAGHTPGEWIVRQANTGHVAIYPQDGKERVADCYAPMDNHDRAASAMNNAALIAAAPSLLTECQRQREVIAELRGALDSFVECSKAVSDGMCPELFDVARAALAKSGAQS